SERTAGNGRHPILTLLAKPARHTFTIHSQFEVRLMPRALQIGRGTTPSPGDAGRRWFIFRRKRKEKRLRKVLVPARGQATQLKTLFRFNDEYRNKARRPGICDDDSKRRPTREPGKLRCRRQGQRRFHFATVKTDRKQYAPGQENIRRVSFRLDKFHIISQARRSVSCTVNSVSSETESGWPSRTRAASSA